MCFLRAELKNTLAQKGMRIHAARQNRHVGFRDAGNKRTNVT